VRFQHIARVTAAAAVIAIAAAGCNSPSSDKGSSSGGKCDLNIGMFGALTGDAANLGKIIHNGIQLAVDQYNEKNKDCKVGLKDYDSQGTPDQAPGLAQKAINDKTVVGIVGPAFSGESKAADPLFDEAGLPIITPSATNPKLAENGWKTFHRILGNDATQGPAAAKYIKDVLKADKVFVLDDPPSTARAWPTSSRATWALPSQATTPSSRSRPTSPPPSARSRAPARRCSSTAATTPRPA